MDGALKARTSSIVFGIVLLGNLFAYCMATANSHHLAMGLRGNAEAYNLPESTFYDENPFIPKLKRAILNFGVETDGGEMAVLIPRGTVVAVKRSKVFTTTRDQQTSVTIQVFQGLRRLTKNCLFLGEFNLTGIPPAPRGTPQIKVTFKIVYNLTLIVEAEAYGISEKLTIPQHDYVVWDEDVEEMKREAEEEEKAEKDRIAGPHSLKNYVCNHINDKDRLNKEKEKEKVKVKETSTSDDPWDFIIDRMLEAFALEQGRARFKNKASTTGNQIAEKGNTT